MNRKISATIVFVIFLASLGVAYASYVMTSNNVTGTVTAQATMSLTLSPTTVVEGQTWTLTSTVSDATAGITVTFKEGITTVGTATTNSAGIATLSFIPLAGSHTYVATATHP